MSEKVLRSWVIKALAPLDAVAVENPACPGTPDVDTVLGWIELKHVEKMPKRSGTPLRIDHYTPQQRLWARRREGAGGTCLLLLQVAQTYFLMHGSVAADHLCFTPAEQLEEVALTTWHKKPTPQELMEAVIDSYQPWDRSRLLRLRNFASSVADRTGV